MRQSWLEQFWYAYANGAAITNTTTETILFPLRKIWADLLQDGRKLRITARGKISNVVTTPGNITARLRWGGVSGTILCQSAAIAQNTAAQTDVMWSIYIDLTVRGNGATGSVVAMGEFDSANFATLQAAKMGSAGAATPAAVTADLTVDTDLALTLQFSIANAANSATGMEYYIEVLN